MRKALLWSLLTVCTWAGAFAPAVRAADEDAYGEHLLPPETLLFFSVTSVPDLVEDAKNSSMGQLFVEPKLQPFINQVKAKIQESFKKEVEGDLGVSLQDLLDLPQGEFTFAILEKPARKLSGVLLVDCSDNEETLNKLLKKMDAALVKNGAEHSTQDLSDIEVHTYKLGGDSGPVNSLVYFEDEGYVVFSTEMAALKAVLERYTGDNDDTLAKADVFAYIQEKCQTGDEEPALKWFIDPIGLVKAGMNMAQNPQQAAIVAAMMPVLGLDKLKGIGGGSDYGVENFEAVSKMFVYAEQPPTGVLAIFQFPPVEQSPPKWAPADVATFFSINWNAGEAYAAVESLVDSLQGPGSTARLVDAFATKDDGPHLHLKKDLVDQLSGRIDVVMQPTKIEADQPPVPELAVTLGVKDATRMKKTVAKAVEADNFPGTTRQVEGQTVYEMPVQGGQKMNFSVGADAIVFASTSALMDRVLQGQSRSSLASTAEYGRFAKLFPKKTSIISFQRSDTQLQSVYDLLKQQQSDSVEGVDFGKLPDYSAVKKYFRPSAGYSVPDKKGCLVVGFTLPGE